MSDAQAIKNSLGVSARDMILQDLGRPIQDQVCCWLHDDKTPSMSWDYNANHFNCFGCNNTYDIFHHYDQYKGLSFSEALVDLAKMTGHILSNDFQKPNLQKKSRIQVSDNYKANINKFSINRDSIDDFLKGRNIDPDISKNIFGVTGSDKEVFFKHYEIIDNQWVDCFSKRRNLDKSLYDINGKTTKELSVANGTLCFFGLNTLWNNDRNFKDYCIITEGQLDALRVATALDQNGLLDLYGVLSVPNGTNSLKTAIENSPTFNKWYRNCKFVILITDNDEAGKKMIEKAGELLSPTKSKYCDLSSFATSKTINDISDILDAGEDIETVLESQDFIPIQDCYKSRDIAFTRVNPGFKSGFLTHDYNDSGLKDGIVTLLTGMRGQGKTTLARQMVMCAALQKIKSFCWFGEGNKEHENARFARMIAREGEINSYDNGCGRKLFEPSEVLQNRFRDEFSDYIYFFEKSIEDDSNIFDKLLHMMKQYAIRGCKLFLLDNLMVMTNASGAKVFSEQKRIITSLKAFAKEYKIHVLLIAHPKKGEGFQAVSGAAEIENTVDTILRYVRIKDDMQEHYGDLFGYPLHEHKKLSAMVINEKVRDEGESNPFFLEWVKQQGIVREVTYMENLKDLASQYAHNGWFSRYYNDVDVDNIDKYGEYL